MVAPGKLMTLLNNPQVLALYRQLLREAERFPQYNYRMYALRKIRNEFESRNSMSESRIPELLERGKQELERLRRMTTVASLYAHDKLVIEEKAESK